MAGGSLTNSPILTRRAGRSSAGERTFGKGARADVGAVGTKHCYVGCAA